MSRNALGGWWTVAPLFFGLFFAGPGCTSNLSGGAGGGGNGDLDDNLDPFPDEPFGPDEDICADLSVAVSGTTPTVSLLIDQSGSMDQDFGNTDRWNAVYDTLMDDDGVVARLEGAVRFGLNLYTSFGGNEGGQCPVLSTVNPQLNNFSAMDQVFAPAGPETDTPTGESIDAVVGQLSQVNEPGPKIIVLGTDGLPDTCEEPNPQNGQEESIAAAQRAYDAGIEIYVVSVGNDVGEEHLQDMANAGVGLPPNGGDNAPFYVALNPDELVSAFEQIIGGVTGCVFTLDGSVDLSRECDGMVALDGQELECGTDWRLIDESTLELLGPACDAVQDGEQHAVAAVFPCGAVVVE